LPDEDDDDEEEELHPAWALSICILTIHVYIRVFQRRISSHQQTIPKHTMWFSV